jgi:hypothetical protein
MGWLHGLPYYTHQFSVQCLQVRLIPELGREGFEGLSSVVLPAVEASVDEGLDTVSEGSEQRRYQEGGDYDG